MTKRLLTLLFVTALGLSEAKVSRRHRGLVEGERDEEATVRHNANTSPLELNVDAKSTYNEKFMALMQSPCRPEYDGYFGATYGNPVRIQYGFKVETQPLTQVMEVLDVIEDKVVDSILSNAFPQMCGFRRERRRLGHASGFRFFKFEEVEKCSAEVSQINYCAVFTGVVNVFGRYQGDAAKEVIAMIDEILNPNIPGTLHSELIKISTAKEYEAITGGEEYFEDSVTNFNALGWAGLVFGAIIFLSGVWWFFIRSEKQGDSAFSNNSKRNDKKRFFGRSSYRSKEYNPEEKSIKPSYEPEAVAFGGGETMLLTDGRPVGIDYDPTYTESTIDPRAPLSGFV